MGRTIARATLVAGTLDILAAIILTLALGRRKIDQMLGYVASGPFPGAPAEGAGAVLLGLLVHFALMAIMVGGYVASAPRLSLARRQPVLAGILFGLITYVVMNLIVVPLRFGVGLPPSLLGFSTQLFCHVVLVGIPTALITARARAPERAR